MAVTLKSFSNGLKKIVLPVLFTIGIGLLVIYYVFKIFFSEFFYANENGFKELMGFGLAITSSGIFLAVLKWFQFMGFFREELHNIIESSEFDRKLETSIHHVVYDDEFLSKRNDLEDLWKRVNRALFKNQFSEKLAEKIEQKMQDLFFHNSNLSHYYENFLQSINVSLDEEDFLTVNITTEAKIVGRSIDEFNYDLCYYIEKVDQADAKSKVLYNKVMIDRTEIELSNLKEVDEGLMLYKRFQTTLQGKKEYIMFHDITLVYKMNDGVDEYRLFAERFMDYFRIEVKYSSNLKVVFIPLGNDDYDEIQTTTGGFIRAYPDILLPEKGFKLILIKK